MIRKATKINTRVPSAETVTRQMLFPALLEILHKILQFIVSPPKTMSKSH